MSEFKKILVANRGEIALRIIKTIKELNKKAVAIYSEPDFNSPHVKNADESYCVGPASSSLSYLNIQKIVEVAVEAGVDAIHPGYGFLSENPSFAKAVKDAGMTFIGPSEKSIEIMGDKISSKKAVAKFNVPLLPGSENAIEDPKKGIELAKKIGFPVLIKASAGGGGKGMRIVHKEDEFIEQMKRAVSEAQSSFNDGRVFVEKYVVNPKHIEFQILRDQHENTVHVFERECSIQRRYQKVVEEAPSVVIDEITRQKMGEAAISAAISCDYEGAGTVEFIFDETKNFYFLEMNTRLQVEHPVTEMITGLDLVKEQISIAEGNPLPFKQQDLKINGHSMEVRVYAENTQDNFLPDSGFLSKYRPPSGPGIRVDDGFEEGMEVSIHYDPMISKLIVHATDRPAAIEKLKRAIKEYQITGVRTSLPFCDFVLGHVEFVNGTFTTAFVEKNQAQFDSKNDESELLAAITTAYEYNIQANKLSEKPKETTQSNWKIKRKQ